MSNDTILTPAQCRVLAELSAGATIAAAAAEAGIHRNTVYNWLGLPAFRQTLKCAEYENAMSHREQARALVADAYLAIREMLFDSKTPPGVRLKAALAIITHAAAPLPDLPDDPSGPSSPTETPFKVHNSAQSHPEDSQFNRVAQPKIGRNQPCPCGSGRKFKYCCLGKPPAGSPTEPPQSNSSHDAPDSGS